MNGKMFEIWLGREGQKQWKLTVTEETPEVTQDSFTRPPVKSILIVLIHRYDD